MIRSSTLNNNTKKNNNKPQRREDAVVTSRWCNSGPCSIEVSGKMSRQGSVEIKMRIWVMRTLLLTIALVSCFNYFYFHWKYLPTEFFSKSVAMALPADRRFKTSLPSAPPCEPLAAENVSFTLVTQSSFSRLWMMQEHCPRWGPHPLSIAVLVANETLAQVKKVLVQYGCSAENLFVNVLSENDFPLQDYPVNHLRNLALSAVKTTHVVYLDIDFWENDDLYKHLMMPQVRQLLSTDDKAALVLPAFKLMRNCQDRKKCRREMPRNKQELLIYTELNHREFGIVARFDHRHKSAHGSTLYDEWWNQSMATDPLLDIPCVQSKRYEPYVVVRYCSDLPPFQEAFTGYGKNKITWILHLIRSGYKFWQLGESFVIHYPHKLSAARNVWTGDSKNYKKKKNKEKHAQSVQRRKMDELFVAFRDWLARYIPDQTRITACETAADDDASLWIDRGDKEGSSSGCWLF